MKLSCGR
ncbi:UNVERIFIED_CONTAM: hypothetical protein GTU68_014589 [Idotea baltica]|nr:hypothetical protein [Idotea baltica]